MRSFIQSRLGRGLLLALGLALMVYLFAQIGVRAALRQASQIGWMFGVILLLGGLPHLLRALSWRRLLRLDEDAPGFLRLLAWWLAGEAISHLSFSWSGETYRVMIARRYIAPARGGVAIALNRVIYSLASLLVAVVGLGVGLGLVELPAGLRTGILHLLFWLGAFLVGALLLMRWGARWWKPHSTLVAPEQPTEAQSRLRRALHELRIQLEEISHRRPGDLAFLFGVNGLAALVGVAEVWLILYALGTPVSVAAALLIEGFLKLLSGLAYFVPGNLGVAEGGFVLILRLLNVSAAAGLALALVRRARALAWVGVGCLMLLALGTGFRAPAEPEGIAAPPEQALENLPRR